MILYQFLCLSTLAFFLISPLSALAQHEHHNMNGHNAAREDSLKKQKKQHELHAMSAGKMPHTMHGSFYGNFSMSRDGSGTSWLPDSSPMEAMHAQKGKWAFMAHGALFPRYNMQDAFDSGSRGASQFDIPSWFMVMGQRTLGENSQLMLRAMVTPEPFSVGNDGYPLLFQTGEALDGSPLIDTQHPHDLFAELSIAVRHTLSERTAMFAYFGLPGEPALGPTAFMHRPSARHIPGPPIAHHWQDATHITFGVATLGLQYDIFKIDGSLFTGREPNEERYGFDKPRFDSYSFRISMNPSEALALQFSPAELEPDIDIRRTTASLIYNKPLQNGNWSTALVWGVNKPLGEVVEIEEEHHDDDHDDEDHHDEGAAGATRIAGLSHVNKINHGAINSTQHSFLLESDLKLGKQAFFSRFEIVEKATVDLALSLADKDELTLGMLTVGTGRELFELGSFKGMLGAQATFYRVPEAVQPDYGSNPISIEIFLRLSPLEVLHSGGHHGMAH